MPTPVNTNCPTGTREDLTAVKLPGKNIKNLIIPIILPMRALPQAGGTLDVATVSTVPQTGSVSGSVATADTITEFVNQTPIAYQTAVKTVAKAIPFTSVSDRPGFTLADKEASLAVNLKEGQAITLEGAGATEIIALATAGTVTIADTGAEFLAAVRDAGIACRKYAGNPVFVTNRSNFNAIISQIPAIKTALSAEISVTATLSEMQGNAWGGRDGLAIAKASSVFGMPVILGEDSLSCTDSSGDPVSVSCWAPGGTLTVSQVAYNKNAFCFVMPAASMMDVMDESNKAVFGFTGLYNPDPTEVPMPADVSGDAAQRDYAAAMIDQYTVIRSQPQINKNGGQNEYTCVARPDFVFANASALTIIAGADKIDLGLSA